MQQQIVEEDYKPVNMALNNAKFKLLNYNNNDNNYNNNNMIESNHTPL